MVHNEPPAAAGDEDLPALLQPEIERTAQEFSDIFGGTVDDHRTAIVSMVRDTMRRNSIVPDTPKRAEAIVFLATCAKLGGTSRGGKTIVESRERTDRAGGKIYGKRK